jgi:hypothetical protein
MSDFIYECYVRDTVHCLRYIRCARRFDSWLYSHLEMLGFRYLILFFVTSPITCDGLDRTQDFLNTRFVLCFIMSDFVHCLLYEVHDGLKVDSSAIFR